MLNKVLKTIRKYNMLSEGDSVTVALSGGADSVALLLALKSLQEELGISIDACHVNHNLRGEEAKRDENFCVELCNRLGVTINVASVDVISKCKAEKLSTELAARELRYGALNHFAKGKIATAHTLSDSLETSIFNFTRGTALRGLCGIKPVRDNIIRPLIDVSRSEIEAFLESCGQAFVNDSTNFENIYSRNKIRNIAIPVLREINPSILSTYERNRENLLDEEDFLEKNALSVLERVKNKDGSLDAASLAKEHTAVRKRVIFDYFDALGASCDYKKVKLIEEILSCGGDVEIKENTFAHVSQGKLSLKSPSKGDREFLNMDIRGKAEETITFNGKTVSFRLLDVDEKKFSVNLSKKAFKNYIDCDKINSNVVIRGRIPGDKFELCGRKVTKSLKKLFNESRLLPQERDEAVILESDGKVIFVEGFGCAESVKTDENTKYAVEISISKS